MTTQTLFAGKQENVTIEGTEFTFSKWYENKNDVPVKYNTVEIITKEVSSESENRRMFLELKNRLFNN